MREEKTDTKQSVFVCVCVCVLPREQRVCGHCMTEKVETEVNFFLHNKTNKADSQFFYCHKRHTATHTCNL